MRARGGRGGNQLQHRGRKKQKSFFSSALTLIVRVLLMTHGNSSCAARTNLDRRFKRCRAEPSRAVPCRGIREKCLKPNKCFPPEDGWMDGGMMAHRLHANRPASFFFFFYLKKPNELSPVFFLLLLPLLRFFHLLFLFFFASKTLRPTFGTLPRLMALKERDKNTHSDQEAAAAF